MVKVKVSNNVDRAEVIVAPETTIEEVFAQAGIAMGSAIPYLNGVPVNGQTHRALKEFDIGDVVTLMAVVNKDNN